MPIPEFVFEPGIFRKFKTLNKIHLGSVSKDIPEKTIVEFDGVTVIFGTVRVDLPGFIGALRSGWAVPVEDNVSLYVPKPAGVTMHNATKPEQEPQSSMTLVVEDEMQVGTLALSNAKRVSGSDKLARETAEQQKTSRLRAAEVTAERKKAEVEFMTEIDYKLPPAKAQSSDAEVQGADEALADIAPKTARGMKIVVEEQDAVSVARLHNPAKRGAVVDDPVLASQEKTLDPVHGDPLKIEHLTVPKKQTLGAKAGETLEELLPDSVTGPVPETKKASSASPSAWDRSGSVKSRAERAIALHGNDKAALDAVLAQETPQVRREIRIRMGKPEKK